MHSLQISRKRKVVLLLATVLSGPLFFMTTNPSNLPLAFLIAPFLWLFVCLFATSWLIFARNGAMNQKKLVIVSGTLATIPVLLVVFQSIYQLSIRDVLISAGLVVLAVMYVVRADFIK